MNFAVFLPICISEIQSLVFSVDGSVNNKGKQPMKVFSACEILYFSTSS